MRWVGWLLPGAVVLTAAAFVERVADASLVGEMLRGYPWVAYGLAFVLAWVFHRSRLALAALVLVGVDLLLTPETAPIRVALTGSVAALALGGLSMGRDRGLLSPGGAVQAGALSAGALVGAFLWWETPQDVTRIFSATPLPEGLTAWTGLPQPVAMAFGLACLAAIWALVRWRGPVERGLAWCIPALAVATHAASTPTASLYLMAGALILALSVIETSYAMAYRDDLTGLPGRRALMRDLEALSGTYTLAMVDVDHFKKFNDRHGHDVGDQVLKMVATRLGRAPGGGKAYRYGGEEFTLLFDRRTREEALPHLESVREAVEGARFSVRAWIRPKAKPSRPKAGKQGGRTLSVTVSIGMADSTTKDPTTEKVLKKADQALYRAKKAGRNRVSK